MQGHENKSLCTTMTELAPPAAFSYRPTGKTGLTGVGMSQPPGGSMGQPQGIGGGPVSRRVKDFSSMNQETNQPIVAKYGVWVPPSQSASLTRRGLGQGQLIFAEGVRAGVRSGQAQPGGMLELVNPKSISRMNEWYKEPAQRKQYGSVKTAPTLHKFIGVQTTQSQGMEMGQWSGTVINLVVGSFYNGFPNIALSHKKCYPGDSVYGVWIRKVFKHDDLSAPMDEGDDDNDVSAAEIHIEKKYDKELGRGASSSSDELAKLAKEIKSLEQTVADGPNYDDNGGDSGTADVEFEDNKVRLAEMQEAYKRRSSGGGGSRQKQAREYYWELVPFVSSDNGAPPKALYTTSECIGCAIRLFGILTVKSYNARSAAGVQMSAVRAIRPRDQSDDFLKDLLALPQCQILVYAQK